MNDNAAKRPDWYDEGYPELRAGPPWVMAEMVASQSDLVAPILAAPAAVPIADAIGRAARAGEPVVVVGCGTSEHGAQAVAELLDAGLRRRGLRGGLVEARQALEAALDPRGGGVCLAISHDGGTRATLLALEAAAAAGATTAAFTARVDGEIARAADLALVTPARDRSWCHTVAYASAILAGAAIGAGVAGATIPAEPVAAALRAVLAVGGIDEATGAAAGGTAGPAAAGGATGGGLTGRPTGGASGGATAAIARGLAGRAVLLVAASGADRVTARELTLKIEEGARRPVAMRALETLLHGHLVAGDGTTGLILIGLDPRGDPRRTRRLALAAEASARVGIAVAGIVSAAVDAALPAALTPAGRLVVPSADDPFPPLLALLQGAAALQSLTLALVEQAGVNPDLIRREEGPYREAARIAEGAADW